MNKMTNIFADIGAVNTLRDECHSRINELEQQISYLDTLHSEYEQRMTAARALRERVRNNIELTRSMTDTQLRAYNCRGNLCHDDAYTSAGQAQRTRMENRTMTSSEYEAERLRQQFPHLAAHEHSVTPFIYSVVNGVVEFVDRRTACTIMRHAR